MIGMLRLLHNCHGQGPGGFFFQGCRLEEKLMPKSIKPTYRDVFLALRIGSAEDQSIKRISKLIRKICIER